MRFIDSYQFLTASLDSLAKSVDNSEKYHTQRIKCFNSSLEDDILFSKGIFPYSYLDSEQKLKSIGLPPISDFHDALSNSNRITDAEYAKAQRAYDQFHCKNFGDYMLSYLELDVVLLADIFQTFRKKCMSDYQLDPVNS